MSRSASSSSRLGRIQWEFDSGRSTWQPFAEASHRQLELANREWEASGRNPLKRTVPLAVGKYTYDINLESAEQTNRSTGRVRKVRRTERPPDSVTTSLQERVQSLEQQLAQTQNEVRVLRRACSSQDQALSSKTPLAIFQDHLRVFRIRSPVQRFSSPSDSSLRQADLPSGALVLAVRQNESTLPSGIRILWQELASGGFIKEHPEDLEVCEANSMQEQCAFVVQAVQESRPIAPTACICVAPSSSLAQSPEYAARLSLSCCSSHGSSRFVVKMLHQTSPEFEFVSRAFQKELKRHRVRYNSEECAERPRLQVDCIYRIFNPELAQRYNLERRTIMSNCRHDEVPETLQIRSDVNLNVCDLYRLYKESVNGWPVWKNGDLTLYLFMAKAGKWFIGDESAKTAQFTANAALVVSADSDSAHLLHKIKAWKRGFVPDPTLLVRKVEVEPQAEHVLDGSDSGILPSKNEFFLWHGTRPEVVQKVEKDGFDPRRGGSLVGKLFGVGTYLAHNASKSDLYGDGDPKGNAQGHKHCVLFVKALLGRIHYTQKEMQTATKPPDDRKGKPFDSVVALRKDEGGCVDLREYIVYKPAQVLPLCRVVYRHLPECKCCRCIR